MCNTYQATVPSATSITIIAGIALILLMAAALVLLQSATQLIPPEVLDGLTTPAHFGPRTT
jgi:hypothetical protein